MYLSRYDHAKYPARCLRDALTKYMKENNITSAELCRRIGWKPQYYSRLSKIDWVLTSKAVFKVENALGIQLPDPEGYDKKVELEEAAKKLAEIYPPTFIQFALTATGYKLLMATYANCTDDEKLREDQRVYHKGLEKLHELGLPDSSANVIGRYMDKINKIADK